MEAAARIFAAVVAVYAVIATALALIGAVPAVWALSI
jgi:hypothetical protein